MSHAHGDGGGEGEGGGGGEGEDGCGGGGEGEGGGGGDGEGGGGGNGEGQGTSRVDAALYPVQEGLHPYGEQVVVMLPVQLPPIRLPEQVGDTEQLDE